MRSPNGIRTESTRTPKASRAGALYATQRYSTPAKNTGRQPGIHLQSVDAGAMDDGSAESKFCRGCKRDLPLTEFHRSRNGHQHRCKDCRRAYIDANRDQINARRRQYVANKPEVLRDAPKQARSHKLRTFGITQEQYDQMLAYQGGVCAICRKPETSRSRAGGPVRALAVDHDHETGVVRGLLCGKCNRGLGLFNDNHALVVAAAAYLGREAA